MVGVVSPQIVKALSYSGIWAVNKETGHGAYGPGYASFRDPKSNQLLPFYAESIFGYLRIPDEAFDDSVPEPIQLAYEVSVSGFAPKTRIGEFRSNSFVRIELDPVVHCGDAICTSGQENLSNCPEDCSVCGDNACHNRLYYYPEHRINCPLDCSGPKFLRGDADGDKDIDAADQNTILNWAYTGKAVMPCKDAGDANDDGRIDTADSTAIGDLLARRRTFLPYPWPQVGFDETPDALNCAKYPSK